MKNIILLICFIFSSLLSIWQIKEGQNFCDESKDGTYFPLSFNEKIILWYGTHYLETKNETKEINGKTYIEFKQTWKNNTTHVLYFREENGVVYEYEACCENETIRYDKNFKKGHIWKSAGGKSEYKITSYKGKLKTPYCDYENLMVIESKMKYGNYNFYYLKGFGYIGATNEGEIVSCLAPELPEYISE